MPGPVRDRHADAGLRTAPPVGGPGGDRRRDATACRVAFRTAPVSGDTWRWSTFIGNSRACCAEPLTAGDTLTMTHPRCPVQRHPVRDRPCRDRLPRPIMATIVRQVDEGPTNRFQHAVD